MGSSESRQEPETTHNVHININQQPNPPVDREVIREVASEVLRQYTSTASPDAEQHQSEQRSQPVPSQIPALTASPRPQIDDEYRRQRPVLSQSTSIASTRPQALPVDRRTEPVISPSTSTAPTQPSGNTVVAPTNIEDELLAETLRLSLLTIENDAMLAEAIKLSMATNDNGVMLAEARRMPSAADEHDVMLAEAMRLSMATNDNCIMLAEARRMPPAADEHDVMLAEATRRSLAVQPGMRDTANSGVYVTRAGGNNTGANFAARPQKAKQAQFKQKFKKRGVVQQMKGNKEDSKPVGQTALKCYICLSAHDVVRASCKEQHTFCRSCFSANSNNCPVCWKGDPVQCPNARSGCNVYLPPDEMENHTKNKCIYRNVNCSASDACNWTGAQLKLRQHVSQAHPKKVKKPCANKNLGCKMFLDRAAMMGHLTECIFRNIPCPINPLECRWMGNTKAMQIHLNESHPETCLVVNEPMEIKHSAIPRVFFLGPYIFQLHSLFDYQKSYLCYLIQLVGTEASAKKWTYTVQVYDSVSPNCCLTMSNICTTPNLPVEIVLNSLKCAAIPLTFLGGRCFSDFRMKFTIVKVEDY